MRLDPFHQQMRTLFLETLELRIAGKSDEAKVLGDKVDELLNKCPSECCDQCGDIFCPWGEALHFHHDGCPCCDTVSYWDTALTNNMLFKRNSE